MSISRRPLTGADENEAGSRSVHLAHLQRERDLWKSSMRVDHGHFCTNPSLMLLDDSEPKQHLSVWDLIRRAEDG